MKEPICPFSDSYIAESYPTPTPPPHTYDDSHNVCDMESDKCALRVRDGGRSDDKWRPEMTVGVPPGVAIVGGYGGKVGGNDLQGGRGGGEGGREGEYIGATREMIGRRRRKWKPTKGLRDKPDDQYKRGTFSLS